MMKTIIKLGIWIVIVCLALFFIVYAFYPSVIYPQKNKTLKQVRMPTEILYEVGWINDGKITVYTCTIKSTETKLPQNTGLEYSAVYRCYVETEQGDIEIITAWGSCHVYGHSAESFGREYGIFVSYESLTNSTFTFLTYSGNITVSNPVKGYVVVEGYECS